MRINLIVPYADKEKVKERGAFWDSETKTWYVNDFYNNPNNFRVFMEWVSPTLSHPTTSKPLQHPPFVVTQPRSTRLKSKKRR